MTAPERPRQMPVLLAVEIEFVIARIVEVRLEFEGSEVARVRLDRRRDFGQPPVRHLAAQAPVGVLDVTVQPLHPPRAR